MADNKNIRNERVEAARIQVAAARSADRRRSLVTWGAVAVVVLVLGAFGTKVIVDAVQGQKAVTEAAARPIEGVQVFDGLSAKHVEGIPEPVAKDGGLLPPVGGDHSADTQTCGIYTEPVPTWNAVHSLEHGAVWVTYEPGLAADQVATLVGYATGHDHVLLSPFTDLNSPVVLSAWGLQLQVDSASDPRVQTFITKYENGPQTPEPGAPCAGVGEPSAN